MAQNLMRVVDLITVECGHGIAAVLASGGKALHGDVLNDRINDFIEGGRKFFCTNRGHELKLDKVLVAGEAVEILASVLLAFEKACERRKCFLARGGSVDRYKKYLCVVYRAQIKNNLISAIGTAGIGFVIRQTPAEKLV